MFSVIARKYNWKEYVNCGATLYNPTGFMKIIYAFMLLDNVFYCVQADYDGC